jgi:hypothetical protein
LSPIAAWDFTTGTEDQVGNADLTPIGAVEVGTEGAHLHDGGYLRSTPLGHKLTAKTLEAWVRLDSLDQQGGGVMSVQTPNGQVFDAIVFGEREPARWMAGSDSFNRTRPFGGMTETDAATQFVHVAIVYGADRTIACYRNGELYGTSYKPPGAAKLESDAVVLIGCRHEPPGGNRMLSGTVQKARLYDVALTAEQVRASALSGGLVASEKELLPRLNDAERNTFNLLEESIRPLDESFKRLQAQAKYATYAVRPEQPGDTRLLRRGDLALAGEVMTPGGIAAIAPDSAQFADEPSVPEATRRQRLAEWITDAVRPLFARAIVNRLWHYHFGVGLVETPSDFGFNGGRPSHPELLDWLAGELIRHGFRLKDIHRLLVTSASYRQSSLPREDALAVDADTRLLWRKRPQRMEGEQVRDSLLAAAGLLNEELGGASFSDYQIIDAMNGTVYYEPDDPVGAEFQRRSIYRFVPRGANQGLLDVFDCPDPAASAPRRNATTTPLQALSLWNGSFALRMAEQIATNAAAVHPDSHGEQISFVYRAVLQREPTDDERTASDALVAAHGLRSLCRALINSNEFLTVP